MPTHNLTIDRPGTGTGGVSATGLTCTGGSGTQAVPCGAAYTHGAAVILTAVPDGDSTFAGWGGACTGTGACQVTMTTARFVVAMFAKIPTELETRYYHTDAIGSVRAITDEAGQTIIRHDYGPFGEDTQPLDGDPRRFTGWELDAETGLNYAVARYYRNIWGRFLGPDPVGGTLTNPQRWNGYAYAGNNPLRYVDPFGRQFRSGVACPEGGDGSAGCPEVGPPPPDVDYDPNFCNSPLGQWFPGICEIFDSGSGSSPEPPSEDPTGGSGRGPAEPPPPPSPPPSSPVAPPVGPTPPDPDRSRLNPVVAGTTVGLQVPIPHPAAKAAVIVAAVLFFVADHYDIFDWTFRPAMSSARPSAWPDFWNPDKPPGPGWTRGGPKENWHNRSTGESLRPNLDHPEPIGPHWDWHAPDGSDHRLYPDGRVVKK